MYKSNISSIYQDISYYLYIRNKRKTTARVVTKVDNWCG